LQDFIHQSCTILSYGLVIVIAVLYLASAAAAYQIDKNKLLNEDLSKYLPDRRSELSPAVVRVSPPGSTRPADLADLADLSACPVGFVPRRG